MNHLFDLDYDRIPSEILNLLPLEELVIKFDLDDRSELLDGYTEVDVRFNVECSTFRDEFYTHHSEELVVEKVTVDGVEIPEDLWEKILPADLEDEILSSPPDAYGDYDPHFDLYGY